MTIIRPDIGLIYSLLTTIAKCIDLSLLIDYSTYFKDVQSTLAKSDTSGADTKCPS